MKPITYIPRKWEICEQRCSEWYNEWKAWKAQIEKSNREDRFHMLDIASQKKARDFICIGFYEGARECLETVIAANEILIKKYKSKNKNDIRKKILISQCNISLSKWMLDGNETGGLEKAESELYRYNVDNASNAAEKKRARNKLIRALLKYGHFDKAKQINAEQYKCKRKTKLREQDIYTRDKFFCCLTDYLAEPKANQATEQDIKKCMQFFFDELIKENTKLFEYDDAGSEMFIDDMAYIWYKYFSDVPFEQIKPADIIKCRRYGVK